jgi:two-component system CheB/CheR fusion protein
VAKKTESLAQDAESADVSRIAPASSAEIGTPSRPVEFPIVGLGASAGGLSAFEAFFSGMPADTDPGMAFVLVQHLAPDHKSLLTELIQRYTHMEVFEVQDGMEVRPNCVYVIPPGRMLAFLDRRLHLLDPIEPHGQRMPIDFLFRSLAQDQRERAIGIVLSGTGSDGTLGVRAIKGEGGMVMAQTPASAEFDGMPCSAIATGLVDYELSPAEMPTRLIAFVTHAFHLPDRALVGLASRTENALKKAFILLRVQTGHDFSHYKSSTIGRRIERRMAVHQIEKLDDYIKFLQQTPAEVDALFRDLLIGVTSFFRDPEAFQVLEQQVIPALFADRSAGSLIRVWSSGCSTGEEAYSLAILLQERMEELKQHYTIQVFATDIDRRAIASARSGLFPVSIASDITPERLARFFAVEPDGCSYRIHKNIRDLVVFSEQDVLKDPPFSKLDLISCRNLLIYLDTELQARLIPLFHYALKPGGTLFLGTSEGIGRFDDLFAVQDRKAKLFQRRDDIHSMQHSVLGRMPSPMMAAEVANARSKTVFPAKIPLRELTEQALLQHVAVVAALVNAQGDILYLHGRTGKYLEPAPGEAGISNVLKMAREGLLPHLTMALHKAVKSKEPEHCPAIRIKTNGHFTAVDLTVRPVVADSSASPDTSLFLVVLEDVPSSGAASVSQVAISAEADGAIVDTHACITSLRQELQAKDDYIRISHEELQSVTEELRSANEEMQSVNEELQSTNEELETSKEEQQSVNEELATVNAELHTKVEALSQANNDMNNLLAGTGIGTIFVDHRLHILRFTPAVAAIINLIPSDVGRPIGHTVTNLVGYDGLVTDIQDVLDTLMTKEVDVQTTMGRWYAMRMLPYRTIENVIKGVVITFVDITQKKLTEDTLLKAHELLRLAVVVRDARDAITVQDLEGRILAWNPGAVRMYGWSEAEALLMNSDERIPAFLRPSEQIKLQELSRTEIQVPYRTQRLSKGGATVDVSVISTALVNEAGRMYAVATTERQVAVP